MIQNSLRRFAALFACLLLSVTCCTAIAADNPRVLLNTSMGEIVLELYAKQAPKSVANFLQYVDEGHYSGTIFHRVIENFMIQGGGFDKSMNQKPTRTPIANEAKNGLKNHKYTLAMARTSNPHSASTQFFINAKYNQFLDYPGQDGWGYAVFGKVIKGMEVVDKITSVETTRVGMHAGVPVKAVVIESAAVIR